MKSLIRNLSALSILFASGHSSGEIIYSNLRDIAIPTTYGGIYIDVDGVNAPSTSSFSGWDFNPFLGGVHVANSSVFQPGRTSAQDMGTLRNFAVGSMIDTNMLRGTGMGGSINHLGNTFTAGSEGYLGFRLNVTQYGWMRVVFTDNTGGAFIKDWAYDNAGHTAIVTGNVQQSAAVNSTQTFTLNSAFGSFTLGSTITNTGGNTNSVVKTGAGTTTLSAASNYTGTTTVSAGTLLVNGNNSASTGAVSVAATLGGNGTVGGATTFTGTSTHAPGSAAATIGTQTFSSSVSYGSGSLFEWDIDITSASTSSYDQISSTGAITGGNSIFKVVLAAGDSFADPFWTTHQSWTSIFAGGAGSATNLAAIFSGFSPTGGLDSFGTVAGKGQFTLNSSTRTLSWTAIPEPTSALVGILLTAGLLRRRRACLGSSVLVTNPRPL